MESNWELGWLEFGDFPTPAYHARLLGDPLRGLVMGRVSPWTITVRKVNLGEVPGIPALTYYNETFISPGSKEAGLDLLTLFGGPRF